MSLFHNMKMGVSAFNIILSGRIIMCHCFTI